MRQRWIIAIATLVILAAIGAGLWLTGTGSDADGSAPTSSRPSSSATQAFVSSPTTALTPTPTPTPVATVTASRAPSPTATAKSTVPPSLPIAKAEKAPAKPVRLLIPKLGVNAPIESVGLESNGNMSAPSTWSSTGWYNIGPKPGDTGNAVIDGHLDSYTGPAVFWHLRDLHPGDAVLVQTADGTTLHFVVIGSQSFDANAFPSKRVFGPATEPRLNLITCNGSWDQSQSQYNQRLVVFTTLATSK